MTPIYEVLTEWKTRAETAVLLEDRKAAHILRLCATELERALQDAGDTPLTLAEAAAESGYSIEHLRRLVSEGRIANAGRRYAPRIRRADLPKKAGNLTAEATMLTLHPPTEQIARLVANRGR
jgi:hypothetical protein